jgi:LPS-assembly protein
MVRGGLRAIRGAALIAAPVLTVGLAGDGRAQILGPNDPLAPQWQQLQQMQERLYRDQAQPPQPEPAPPTPQRRSGRRGEQEREPIVFAADEVQYDQELAIVVARGNVEIAEGQRILLADTVTYNQRTDTVTASGHVRLLEPTGEVINADYLELTDQMRDGFIKDVRILLTDRSRLVGNTGRRTNGNRTEIRRGVYSSCDLCRDDPTRPPLWQLKAERVTHDQEAKVIEYRDARLEFGGVPVLYTPYLSHPDPTVHRQSGFLAPTVGNSTDLGVRASIPYYFDIAPDKDFTFSPMFTSNAGTVIAGEYRQRWGFGEMQLAGSIVPDSNVIDSATGLPRDAVRGHAFGRGRFNLDENWRTGFDLYRATDQTYLLRYRFNNIATFLTSDAYAERFGPRSYFNSTAYAFQTLRPGTQDKNQPLVLPVASYNKMTQPDANGATWEFNANALDLYTPEGPDSRRLSLGSAWRLPVKGSDGQLFSFTAALRGDGYLVDNAPLDPSGGSTFNGLTGRIFPQLAADWRWPFTRTEGRTTELIEPIVAVFAAPPTLNTARIPNTDSSSIDFGEGDLFRRNRFPGYDLVDSGQRVDYGLRGAVYGDGGGRTTFIVGQSYRLQQHSPFPLGSGLENQLSDIVGAVTFAPDTTFDMTYRFRRGTNFRDHRQEVIFSGGPPNLRMSASYLSIPQGDSVLQNEARQEVSGLIRLGLTRYWGLQLSGTEDFAAQTTLSSSIAAIYQDECIAFIASVSQSGIRSNDVTPGVTVLASVVLKNLGELVAPVLQTSSTQSTTP